MAIEVPSPDDPGTVELAEWCYVINFDDGTSDWMDIAGKGDHQAMALSALRGAPEQGETSRAAMRRTVTVTFGEWETVREVATHPTL